jgi:hypothetical protein
MLCPVLRDVVLRWAARPHITGTLFFLSLFLQSLVLSGHFLIEMDWVGGKLCGNTTAMCLG